MMEYLRESHIATGILIRAVWLLMFLRKMPLLNRSIQQFLDFSEKLMNKRLTVSSSSLSLGENVY